MSYDLTGFRPLPGESPEEAVERLEERAGDERPPSEAAWAEIRRIADALEAVAGGERFELTGHGGIELTLERFQVSVFEHEAGVTIPYWDGTGEAEFTQVEGHLAVFRAAGFVIWDPQTEEVVEPGAAGNGFAPSLEAVRPILERQPSAPPPKQRRWPFGRRR